MKNWTKCVNDTAKMPSASTTFPPHYKLKNITKGKESCSNRGRHFNNGEGTLRDDTKNSCEGKLKGSSPGLGATSFPGPFPFAFGWPKRRGMALRTR